MPSSHFRALIARTVGAIDPVTCFHHSDRVTARSCTRCDRPACSDCLHDAPVGSHCWQCIKAARPPAAERARRWSATAGPLVTKVLIGLNVAVFILTAASGGALGRGGNLQAHLALDGPDIAAGQWYRLVTAGFIHYGLIHLGFNMVLLYQFGSMLETALGRLRFLALFVAALLAGSFGVVLLSPLALTGGASGAVFGLVGAAAVGMRQRGISIWQSGVGGLLAINLIITFAVPGISIGGHVGGLVGGAAAGSVMLRSPTSRRSAIEGVMLAAFLAVVAVVGAIWAAHR